MIKKALLGLSIISLSTATTQAVTIYGLTSTNNLISFESTLPGVVTNIGTISQSGIVDIDFSPVNGLLYGFNGSGQGYTISTSTALATLVVTPTTAFDGTVTDADFNPAADRVRIYTNGATTENYRMTPDAAAFNNAGLTAGAVTTDGNFTDANVILVGSAYTNPFDGTASTTLYSIDSASNFLIIHSVPAAFNTVAAVGTLGLGFDAGSAVGFDIDQSNSAFVSNGADLYALNLTSGVASSLGSVGTGNGSLVSIAVPEPGTWAALLVGLGAVFAFSKTRKTAAAKV